MAGVDAFGGVVDSIGGYFRQRIVLRRGRDQTSNVRDRDFVGASKGMPR